MSLVGCTDGSESVGSRQDAPGAASATLDEDPAALETMRSLEQQVRELQFCSPACRRSLDDLRRRFGSDPRLLDLERSVLAGLQDWGALIQLEESRPEARRTPGDRARLAGAYYRAGRFRDAADALEKLQRDHPSDDVARQLAVVRFWLGEHDEAMRALDRLEDGATAAQRAEAELLRGLAAHYRGEPAQAQTHLEHSLQLAPGSVAAQSALARVLAARGEATRARELLAESEEARVAATAETTRRMRLNTQSHLASEACGAQQWDRCFELVRGMLSQARGEERLQLQRYLAQVLETAGRSEEAAAATREAEELATALRARGANR